MNAFSVERMRLRSLLLSAALASAAPLAAQDVPRAPTLLRVPSPADGTVLALDSAATARAGDGVFVVNAVHHFAPGSARHGAGGHRVVNVMRFHPAKVRGVAVPVWLTRPITFRF